MSSDHIIRLAGITPESVVDGLGLRFVIWAQGCRHHCPHCHSPFTWDFKGGRLYKMDDLIQEISKNPMLKGVTFSGGDPMEQAPQFTYLARQVRKRGLDVWCYTGYIWDEILENAEGKAGWGDLLNNIDVLVDGRFNQGQRDPDLAFRGSGNQRIIDVPASLEQNRVVPLPIQRY